jgi:hypothetical protein
MIRCGGFTNILAAIKREEKKLEKQLKVQHQLDAVFRAQNGRTVRSVECRGGQTHPLASSRNRWAPRAPTRLAQKILSPFQFHTIRSATESNRERTRASGRRVKCATGPTRVHQRTGDLHFAIITHALSLRLSKNETIRLITEHPLVFERTSNIRTSRRVRTKKRRRPQSP